MSTVTTPPPIPPPGALSADQVPPEPRRLSGWMTKRLLLGALGIVLVSGLAAAMLVLGEINRVVRALEQNGPIRLAPNVLASASTGAPQTLLLVGDDRRPPPKNNPGGFVIPHSNEMLLVRIDPSKPTISMLSIPRDLRVTIKPPGAAPTVKRINVAYSIGGIQLMTETIERVLGTPINHVVVITFPKFKRAVNEMGCIYTTIDRRYFHVNEPGGEQYFEINLQPGYQRLCGSEALQFVAYRHGDTALIRDARDQRLLLDVKSQYGPTLLEARDKFEHIFGKAVETDVHGTGQVLALLELLVQSQGKPVRQAHFQATLGSVFVTATRRQITESVQSFLNGTASASKQKLPPTAPASPTARSPRRSSSQGLALSATPGSQLAHARANAPLLSFTLEYPRVRDTSAGASADTLRLYDVRDPGGHLHSAYTIVIDRGQLGEFYDVQGTTWLDPPLLRDPTQTAHVGSRTYGLFYEGEKIRTIAWREGHAVYWIENTLIDSVSPRAMLTIAEHTIPVIMPTGPASATVTAAGFTLSPRASAATSPLVKLGALLGFLGLLAVAFFAWLISTRQRELRVLRDQVAAALAAEARQRRLLGAASDSQSEA